jgi:hypothetical protein
MIVCNLLRWRELHEIASRHNMYYATLVGVASSQLQVAGVVRPPGVGRDFPPRVRSERTRTGGGGGRARGTGGQSTKWDEGAKNFGQKEVETCGRSR